MYEWDEEKNQANIRKHGVGFETAKRIFENRILTRIDDRSDYGEVRQLSLGMVGSGSGPHGPWRKSTLDFGQTCQPPGKETI